MAEHRTKGLANIAYALGMRDSKKNLFNQGADIGDYQAKQSSRSGWGRLFGGAAASGLLTLLTGGASAPWQLALAAGAGSRLGSEVGERSVKGRKKYNTAGLLFGADSAKSENRNLSKYYDRFNENQWMQAGTDALSTFLMADKINKFGERTGDFIDAGKEMGVSGVGDWMNFAKENVFTNLGKNATSVGASSLPSYGNITNQSTANKQMETDVLENYFGGGSGRIDSSFTEDNSALERLFNSPVNTSNPGITNIHEGLGNSTFPLTTSPIANTGVELSPMLNMFDPNDNPLIESMNRQNDQSMRNLMNMSYDDKSALHRWEY